MPSRRAAALFTAGATMLAGVTAAAASGGGAAQPHGVRALGFGTPVVVDFFRPGFEPDLAIDRGASGESSYVSFPFGFSTTQTFVYRSDPARTSFHLVSGNVAGKTETCAGGGDSELKIDPVNRAMYLVDLQGLTNFSTSVSYDHGQTWTSTCQGVNGVGVDRQWVGLDSNGGTAAVGPGPQGGRLYLDYDNVAQNTDTGNGGANFGGNQLVMNESVDGVHYGSGCTTPGVPCAGPPAVISRDEGIPGNVVVDNTRGGRYRHSVYAIHTGTAGDSVIVSYCRGGVGDDTAAQVAADCTDPTQVDPTDAGRVNRHWHDAVVRPGGKHTTGNLFPAIAIDTAGNLYAVWAEYPVDDDGEHSGPGRVLLSTSSDGAQHWTKPVQVSPADLGNDVMPWVAAGDPGRIAIAWYGAEAAKNAAGAYGPDTLDNGVWNVYGAMSTDALAGRPHFDVTAVSDHPVKFGNISTEGLGGSPDRSLGDFMQVQVGKHGEAVVVYVDETSANRNPDFCQGCGQTPPEAAGPAMVATQDAGPSLYAAVREVAAAATGAGSATDPAGDAYLGEFSQEQPAPPAFDLRGVSVSQPDPAHLQITLDTGDPHLAADLASVQAPGGPVGEWIVRWAAPSYAKPGDGNQFYVGMESAFGQAPTFYTGTTGSINTTHAKYFTYPATTAVPGKISGATIVWTVPLSAVGKPASGDGLFSITGFTASQLLPSQPGVDSPNGGQVGDINIPNLLDATPPTGFTVGR